MEGNQTGKCRVQPERNLIGDCKVQPEGNRTGKCRVQPEGNPITSSPGISGCHLCPRDCGTDRSAGKKGVCGCDATVRVARIALHFWEEPCISNENGSGAVFFSGCSLHCIFCQNRKISGGAGREMSVTELAAGFLSLQGQGAANINLVTPTHFVPQICEALRLAKRQGLTIPIVYNTSAYEKEKTLEMLCGLVDIYLPDFKYMDAELARRYSHAADYPDVAKAAIDRMVEQVGEPVFDEKGMMKKGVIVRHLALPGHGRDSRAVLDYLWKRYGNRIYVSIMNQYTPPLEELPYPNLNRKLSEQAYERLVTHAISLGIEQAYIQEGDTAQESFIPEFDLL